MTNLYIYGDISLSESLFLENRSINLILSGNFKSQSDLTLKVKNLFIDGQFNLVDFDAKTEQNMFFIEGCKINCKRAYLDSNSFFTNLNEKHNDSEEIKTLGVNINRRFNGRVAIDLPKNLITY